MFKDRHEKIIPKAYFAKGLMFKMNTRRMLTIIAVIGLLIFLHFLNILRPAERLLVNLLNPIMSGIYSVGSNLRIKYNEQTSKIDLLEATKQLEARVNQLIEENVKLKIIEEENKILRDYLKFLTNNKFNYLMSNVISRGDLTDITRRTETIVIDKGLKDGVYPGLGVVSSEGIIIGKVVEVKDRISKVYLTNNNKCKLAATILNQEKTNGIAEGELGLTIKMEFIPQSEEVIVNDIIVTSGLEQSIPRGLVIGRVTEVNKESNELWQTARLSPIVDSDDLIIVSVLLP